jgi:hypothetical protein
MARVFAPVLPPGDPRLCQPWLNRELRRLSAAVIQGQRGLSAIARGEAPDASGSPLVDLTGVFLLAGRFGGQTGAGDKSPGGNLTLTSTQNASKGFIYFGVSGATRMAFDETNCRLGIGTDTPQRRLHLKSTVTSSFTFMRLESGGTDVITCVSDGSTTVTHASSGFAAVSIGMLVTGILVPAGTTVVGWTSAGSITLSNAISAIGSPSTMTFYPQAEFLYDGTEYQWSSSAALKIVATGGVTPSTASGLRFLAASDGTAAGNLARGHVQFGPTNLNGMFTGFNGANGNSLRTMFSYMYFGTWGGVGLDLTQSGHVGINADPYDFSTASAINQPGSLHIARRTSEQSGVSTVAVEPNVTDAGEQSITCTPNGTTTLTSAAGFANVIPGMVVAGGTVSGSPPSIVVSVTNASIIIVSSVVPGSTPAALTFAYPKMAYSVRAASTGTRTSRSTGGGLIELGGLHHDGSLVLTHAGSLRGNLSGSETGAGSGKTTFLFRDMTYGLWTLRGGRVASWTDNLTEAQASYFILGDTSITGSHRATFFCGQGFNPLTRFGISSAYTLISNGQAGGGSGGFPGPDTGPSVLFLLNTSTLGADTASLLTLKTLRTGQSADFLKVLDSNGTNIASISATGVFTGNSADVFMDGDAVSYDDDSVYYSTVNP